MSETTQRFQMPGGDVGHTLTTLLDAVRESLGERFVALYLYGSLASGDFNPETSDIDFIVVTDGEIPDDLIAQLETMHQRLWATGGKWAAKLEGTYISQAALRRWDPNDPPRPIVNEGRFYLAQHGPTWMIERHLIRKHGAALVGPDPQLLIDPVTPADLRLAVSDTLRHWWRSIPEDPVFLRRADYQAFAVLTMCRTLYTLEQSDVASKPVSAGWALTALDEAWHGLIAQAVAWRPGDAFERAEEVKAFIRYTLAHANV